MTRTRRILGGASIGYLQQAVMLVVGLWLTPFLLRHLGQPQLGLWLAVGQILGYLALMDLGVLAILPREIALASSQGAAGTASIARLIARVTSIVRWQIAGLTLVAVLMWIGLPDDWRPLQWPLAIVLASFIVLYRSRVSVAVLQGLQELPFLATTQLVGWVLGTLSTIALVLFGAGLYALVIGWVVSMLVPAAAALYRTYGRWEAAADGPNPLGEYFSRSLWVSVGQIAQVLLSGSDVLILGRMLGAAAIVPYACTGKLVTVFANHPQLLMHAAQPALSELRGSASRDRLATVSTALTHVMLMMSGALAVAILSANGFFVSWWVGEGLYSGSSLTIALVIMMLLRHWNVAAIYTLFCFGHERRMSVTNLIDGLVTVIASALLVRLWGPIGAPLGSIAGVLAVSLPLNIAAVARELELSPLAFTGAVAPVLLRVAAVAVPAAGAAVWWQPASLLATLAIALPAGMAYAALMLPLAWSGPVGPYVRLAFPSLDRLGARTRPRDPHKAAAL